MFDIKEDMFSCMLYLKVLNFRIQFQNFQIKKKIKKQKKNTRYYETGFGKWELKKTT